MSCKWTGCAQNTIHGTCRYSGNPKTCAYGVEAEKEEAKDNLIAKLWKQNRVLRKQLKTGRQK